MLSLGEVSKHLCLIETIMLHIGLRLNKRLINTESKQKGRFIESLKIVMHKKIRKRSLD